MKTILGGLWVIVNYWSKEEACMNSESAFANDFDIYGISDSVKKNTTYNLLLASSETNATTIDSKEQELTDIYFGKIHSLRKNQPKYPVIHPDEDLFKDEAYMVIWMKNWLNLWTSSICGILGLSRSYVTSILWKYRKKL